MRIDELTNPCISNFSEIKTTKNAIDQYKKTYPRLRYVKTGSEYDGMLLLDEHEFVAVLQCNTNTGYIVALEVSPSYRGRGIASALLDIAISTYNCPKLSVNKHNKTAFELYIRNGYTISSEDDNMYYMEIKTPVK